MGTTKKPRPAQVRRTAFLQASGTIASMDLGQLFGDDLYDKGLIPSDYWIIKILDEVQKQIVRNLIKASEGKS